MKAKTSVLEEFILGIQNYLKAIKLFWKHRLALYLLFPLLFNIGLFILGFSAVGELTDQLISESNIQKRLSEIDVWGMEGLGDFLYWLIWLATRLVYFFIYSILSGNIIMIFLSPVLALLSEKVEKIKTGNDYPFRFDKFIRESFRGLIIALRNMLWQIGAMILFFILGFVPFLGAFVPIAILLVSSYFYGFSFLDYNVERKGLSVREGVRFMRAHKGLAIGNGLPFTLILLIPFIGGIFASFFAVLSVIAASSAMTELEQTNNYSPQKS